MSKLKKVWATPDHIQFSPTDEQKRILDIAGKYSVTVEFVEGGWVFRKNGREDSGSFDLPDFNIDKCAADVAGMERV